MLGAVIGDIVGSAYEFNPVRTQDFEPFVEGRTFFTDDSVLTFATAEILMDGGDYAEAYRRWGTDYPGRGYGGRFALWLRGGITGASRSRQSVCQGES